MSSSVVLLIVLGIAVNFLRILMNKFESRKLMLYLNDRFPKLGKIIFVLIGCFFYSLAFSADSSLLPFYFRLNASQSASMPEPSRYCCHQVVADVGQWKLLDCYPGKTWNCSGYVGSAFGQTNAYSGTFGCNANERMMKFSTYNKYNYDKATWQMMVRAAWCAPVLTQCAWIPASTPCPN